MEESMYILIHRLLLATTLPKTGNDGYLWEEELNKWGIEMMSIYFSPHILLCIFKLCTMYMGYIFLKHFL